MAHMQNTSDISLGTASAAVTATHASVIFHDGTTWAAATNKRLLWTGALANSRTLASGDDMEFPADSLVIEIPNNELEGAALKAMMDQFFGDYDRVTVLLGTAAMGSAGESNQVPSGSGFTPYTAAPATAFTTSAADA